MNFEGIDTHVKPSVVLVFTGWYWYMQVCGRTRYSIFSALAHTVYSHCIKESKGWM